MATQPRFLHALFFALIVSAFANADTLPTLPEAFGSGTPGAGGVARGIDLVRIDVAPADYPDALCADGSNAVFYVRAASNAAHRDDWVVYLQGGGSCDNGQDCHERWLGRDGNFGANKLSSGFAPQGGIRGGGIQSPDTGNPFAAWNHVFLFYCSSDGWAGQARDRETAALHRGVPTAYRVHLLGARIVDAVFDLLRRGQGPVAYRDHNGVRRVMPDLDQASSVLFSGSSAGGGGVRSNADRIASLLRDNSLRCGATGCGPRYAALIDASYGLGQEALDYAGSRACGLQVPADDCTYEISMRRQWFDVLRGFRQGFADTSCIDYHTPRGDEWRCADGVHTLQHHVMTPFFVRADLQDRLVMGNTIDNGFGYAGVPLDRELYGRLEEIQLRELATLAERSEEPRPASDLEPPGVFGPQCGDHETLRSDEPTLRRGIIDSDGTRYTLFDVLANWLTGRDPSALVETYSPDGPPASCRLR